MKNEKRKGDRQLEKDNKETIAQENVEKETLVQEENKEKENKKTNTKEDKKETKIKEEKSSSDSVEDTNQKSKGRFVVPAIIAVILIAFAGVIIWQNFIKPKTDINDKLGFNTDDYITVGNIKGLTYDLTQKEWDESINEDTDYTEDVNRASKSGDEISFSYTAYINNKKIEDLSEKEQSIDLGSYDSGIYKLFSDKLIGVKKGDKVTVKVTDGKEANELSRKKLDYTGKKITYKLSVEAVSEKHRDKITDQWVKDNYYEALGLSNKKEYYQLIFNMMMCMTVFLIVSYAYPNVLHLRPSEFPRENVFTDMVRWLYRTDTPTNVLPSIHVFNSLAVHMSLTNCEALRDHKGVRYGSLVLTLLIIMSTMFLKQHSVIDVCCGATLALFGYLFFYPQKAGEEASGMAVERIGRNNRRKHY